MTAHETALARSLAGGPLAAEDAEHLRGCAECREELEALRGLEASLRAAKPAAGREGRDPIPVHRPPRLRRAYAAAAAALFAGALAGGWLGPRDATPAQPVAAATAALGGESESTFALLSALQDLSAEGPTDDELAEYLETHWGG